MKKLFLGAAVLALALPGFTGRAVAQSVVDYPFLAECAAVFSAKAVETQGDIPPDYTENYYEVAAKFYQYALRGGGDGMKALYNDKLSEFKNTPNNDAVGKQYKRALEKQCRGIAPDFDIRFKR
ncbi:MAG: hypothetical protein KDI90_11155 [Alphaproteobacteria bacterium]|nr:hypothetical protein [Alphaproteobacteria bacterium]